MNKTQVGLLGGVALAVTSVCAAEQNGWRSLFDDKLSNAVFDPSVCEHYGVRPHGQTLQCLGGVRNCGDRPF